MRREIQGLPGADWILRGLRDQRLHQDTPHAALVAIGAPRLRALGIDVPDSEPWPELRLYQLLLRAEPDPYSAYNAMIRRLTRFERALERWITMVQP